MQLNDALLQFSQWAIGRTIRGQQVVGVSLDIDTISQPEHPLRYILMVHFAENPVPANEPGEMSMLRRVFNEVPNWASIVLYDPNVLMELLTGTKAINDNDWRLSDET